MKRLVLLTAALLISTTSALAGVDIKVGKGKWICSSEGIKDYPTLARANSKTKAKYLAQRKCTDYEASSTFCEVQKCVKDKNRNNINVDINFSIDRIGSSVSINLNNGQAGYVCVAEAFSDEYIAEAPTKLEAQVLARQTCIADGRHGMHCDVESCEKVERSNVRGVIDSNSNSIDLEDAIRGFGSLFGGN